MSVRDKVAQKLADARASAGLAIRIIAEIEESKLGDDGGKPQEARDAVRDVIKDCAEALMGLGATREAGYILKALERGY